MQHPCTGLATLVHLQAKYADFLKRSIYFLKPNARIQIAAFLFSYKGIVSVYYFFNHLPTLPVDCFYCCYFVLQYSTKNI